MRSTFLKEHILSAIRGASALLPEAVRETEGEIRTPDRPEFGDFSSNVALLAAKAAEASPRELAAQLRDQLLTSPASGSFERIEVAGPGFLNVFLKPETIQRGLEFILRLGPAFGRSEVGEGRRLQVEFVSSNPTGPLTVGHGRQAVLGDVLASLYERIGYRVEREYYFNDEGRQIDLLAESLWVRYRELFGEAHPIPEGGYQGEYLRPLAEEVREAFGDAHATFDEETRLAFRSAAVERITQWIRDDLAALGIGFDHWFSETTLHRRGDIEAALELLRSHDGVYEEDGAVWLKAEANGGAKDSVLIRGDGRPTYMMVDIAYHIDKHKRGYDQVVDVQGADHQVEQTCVKAALRLLGYPETFLRYAVHQFVSLKEAGEVQRMSTRAGRFVTLRDLLDELGKDVVRFFMISRKPEAHLDFDLDLARSQSIDNPATYIQYAHTRIASIFRKAEETLPETDDEEEASIEGLSPLRETEELELIKILDQFPEIVRIAAEEFAPHLVSEYALGLSRSFHAYYDKHRVLIPEDLPTTRARLALLRAIRIVLRHCLDLLGMDAPEAM
jgi:arginyl-tRNA synthetase